jgi:hypothetical protein
VAAFVGGFVVLLWLYRGQAAYWKEMRGIRLDTREAWEEIGTDEERVRFLEQQYCGDHQLPADEQRAMLDAIEGRKYGIRLKDTTGKPSPELAERIRAHVRKLRAKVEAAKKDPNYETRRQQAEQVRILQSHKASAIEGVDPNSKANARATVERTTVVAVKQVERLVVRTRNRGR